MVMLAVVALRTLARPETAGTLALLAGRKALLVGRPGLGAAAGKRTRPDRSETLPATDPLLVLAAVVGEMRLAAAARRKPVAAARRKLAEEAVD